MLLKKYEPKTTKEILGNVRQVSEVRNWLRNWRKGRALFIYGPTGSGKSLAIRLLAGELGYEILESDASDRSIPEIIKASGQRSLFFKKKLILIDEIDLSPGKAVTDLIKKSNFPVIFIAINPYKSNLALLRKSCALVKFDRVRYDVIARFLRDTCEKEKLSYDEKALSQIARMSNGDVRAALIDLEVLKPNINLDSIGRIGYREREENIFNTLKVIFSSSGLNDAKIAVKNCELSPDELFLWLEENVRGYQNIEDIANAYNYLSKSDIFRSRIIKRQAWSLQKYFFDLSIAGFVLNKGSVFNYQYPKIFYAKKNLESTKEKIAKKLHISKRGTEDYFPIIRFLMNKTDIANEFGFDENDMEELENF